MRKIEELTDPKSCLSRALDDEPVFVLLGRDLAAPAAIRSWASERIYLRKNQWTDAEIVEALNLADAMEKEWHKIRRRLKKGANG